VIHPVRAGRRLPNAYVRQLVAELLVVGERERPRAQELIDGQRQPAHRARGEVERLRLDVAPLEVDESKTDAGHRVVDLPPAVRDELAVWLDACPFKRPTDPLFPTQTGKPDNRNNVRRRLLVKAIERANVRLAELGMEPIGKVGPHGLRRTYASLRHAVGDEIAFTSAQLGHSDPGFSLRVYVHAARRRERLMEAERREFNRAVEWAQWALPGTSDVLAPATVAPAEHGSRREAAAEAGS
jgi:integrase